MQLTREQILALPAGPELDALVATAIGALGKCWNAPPYYSRSEGAAFLAVDALAALGCGLILEDWRSLAGAPGPWAARFDLPDGHDTGTALGQSAAHAIARAILLAKEILDAA